MCFEHVSYVTFYVSLPLPLPLPVSPPFLP